MFADGGTEVTIIAVKGGLLPINNIGVATALAFEGGIVAGCHQGVVTGISFDPAVAAHSYIVAATISIHGVVIAKGNGVITPGSIVNRHGCSPNRTWLSTKDYP